MKKNVNYKKLANARRKELEKSIKSLPFSPELSINMV
jgi:hypothetical protein